MKRIINSMTYNTDTATIIATWNNNSSALYVTRGGAFFIADYPDTDAENLRPVEEDEARQWAEGEIDPVELFNTDIFAEPPEASKDEETEATIYLRVPMTLKKVIEEEATKGGQSVNAWAMRCLEKCVNRPNA